MRHDDETREKFFRKKILGIFGSVTKQIRAAMKEQIVLILA